MVYDASDGYVLLFGGDNATGFPPVCSFGCARAFNDTWEFKAGVWKPLHIPAPSPRLGASMVYDAADGYVLLFGGELWSTAGPGALTGETWSYHAGAWTNRMSAGPSARFDAPIAFDQAAGDVLLYGGVLSNGTVARDTWTYFGGLWSVVPSSGPPPDAYQESMTYDAADGYVLLLGTSASSIAGLSANVSWAFHQGRWTEVISSSSPPFLWGAWVAFDPAAGFVILVGEQLNPNEGGFFNVTWGYFGGAWFPVPTLTPSLRLGLSPLTFDPLDGFLLAFGGEQWPNGTLPGTLLNDTWAFEVPPIGFDMSVSASPQGICAETEPACPAGTNETRVTMELRAVYVDPNDVAEGLVLSVPYMADPTFTYVPVGNVTLPAGSNLTAIAPSVACYDPIGYTDECDTTTTLVREPGGSTGLSWRWSNDSLRDQMIARAEWVTSFTVTVAGPPIGYVPVDACTVGACATESATVGGNFSSFTVYPYDNGTGVTESFPLGVITVEPPSLTGGNNAPTVAPPPPPPAPPLPPSPPPAILLPGAPGPSSTPGTATGFVAVGPITTGMLAAGFTRIAQPRKVAMGVAAPTGLSGLFKPGSKTGSPDKRSKPHGKSFDQRGPSGPP
jgi:hypothetical protein